MDCELNNQTDKTTQNGNSDSRETESGVAVVIVAGGMGSRMCSTVPKQFMSLCNKPILQWSLECFESIDEVKELILVIPEDRIIEVIDILSDFNTSRHFKIVSGGIRRQDSVLAGIKSVSKKIAWVMVHDAARPGITKDIVVDALKHAIKNGNAVCAMPSQDTLVKADGGKITTSLNRNEVFKLQTPQIFKHFQLLEALEHAEREGIEITDESSIMTHLGHTVYLVKGSERNMKITKPQDLDVLSVLLSKG